MPNNTDIPLYPYKRACVGMIEYDVPREVLCAKARKLWYLIKNLALGFFHILYNRREGAAPGLGPRESCVLALKDGTRQYHRKQRAKGDDMLM